MIVVLLMKTRMAQDESHTWLILQTVMICTEWSELENIDACNHTTGALYEQKIRWNKNNLRIQCPIDPDKATFLNNDFHVATWVARSTGIRSQGRLRELAEPYRTELIFRLRNSFQ